MGRTGCFLYAMLFVFVKWRTFVPVRVDDDDVRGLGIRAGPDENPDDEEAPAVESPVENPVSDQATPDETLDEEAPAVGSPVAGPVSDDEAAQVDENPDEE